MQTEQISIGAIKAADLHRATSIAQILYTFGLPICVCVFLGQCRGCRKCGTFSRKLLLHPTTTDHTAPKNVIVELHRGRKEGECKTERE
mmetsp:Transcript_5921/g.17806  ORF Transcript_5921/g.17806 Transcript_5921/m.17806 type:complete len:89 (+) Transcript_5921:1290-1556(+)